MYSTDLNQMKFVHISTALAPVGISRIWGKLRLAEAMIVPYFTITRTVVLILSLYIHSLHF